MHRQTGTISVTTSLSPNRCLLVRRDAREDLLAPRRAARVPRPALAREARPGRRASKRSRPLPKAGAARASGRAHNGRAYSRGAERNRPRPPPVFPAPRGRFGGGWRGARPWGARVAILASERARVPRGSRPAAGRPPRRCQSRGRARRPAPRRPLPASAALPGGVAARVLGSGGGRAAPQSGGRGTASPASRAV